MTANSAPFRIAVRQFDPFAVAMAREWDLFCAQEGLEIPLEAVSLDLHPLFDSLHIQGGLQDGTWDVVFCPTDWLALLHAAGSLTDLSPYIQQVPPPDYPQGWTDSLLQMQRFGEATLGLPYHDGPECLIFRKDLFADEVHQQAFAQAHGKPLAVPRTWDDFVDVARYFHRPEEGLYGTVLAAFPDAHNTIYDFHLQLWTRGGSAQTSAGAVTLDTPEAIAALSFYRELIDDSTLMHPEARDMDSVKSGFAFAHGQVALMVNWFGFASMCETIPDSTVKGKVGITSLPSLTGQESVSLNVYWVLALAQGCTRKDLAYRFLCHCASPEADRRLTLDGGIGCRRSTWKDAEVNQEIPYYQEMESLHAVARTLPRLSNWNEVSEIIDQLVLETINSQTPIHTLTQQAQTRIQNLA